MPVSEAQKKATAKFEKQKYDKVLIRLEKGDKDRIKAHADSRDESLNGFIKRAIDETLERDSEYAVLSGTAEIQPDRMDKFTSDAGDFEIVSPAPKKSEVSKDSSTTE